MNTGGYATFTMWPGCGIRERNKDAFYLLVCGIQKRNKWKLWCRSYINQMPLEKHCTSSKRHWSIYPASVNATSLNIPGTHQHGKALIPVCLTHWCQDKMAAISHNLGISIKISLKFVHKGPINNIRALVQMMAWRRPGDKPLSEPMVVRLPTHICVTRPQWVR